LFPGTPSRADDDDDDDDDEGDDAVDTGCMDARSPSDKS
jgi:hypothetical protein